MFHIAPRRAPVHVHLYLKQVRQHQSNQSSEQHEKSISVARSHWDSLAYRTAEAAPRFQHLHLCEMSIAHCVHRCGEWVFMDQLIFFTLIIFNLVISICTEKNKKSFFVTLVLHGTTSLQNGACSWTPGLVKFAARRSTSVPTPSPVKPV